MAQRVRGRAGRYRRLLSRAHRGQRRAPHAVVRPQAPRARRDVGWAARRLMFGALGTLLLPLTSEVSLPVPPLAMLDSAPVLAAEAILSAPCAVRTVSASSNSCTSRGAPQALRLMRNGRITIAAHPHFNPEAAQLIAAHQISSLLRSKGSWSSPRRVTRF